MKYTTRVKLENALVMVGLVLAVLAFIGLIIFTIWARSTWDCSHLGWMPAKDAPARCIGHG